MPNIDSATARERPKTVIFGEFMPDQADLESEGLTKLRNAYPLSAGHYGPARALSRNSKNSISDLATVERVVGSIGSFKDLDTNDVTLFAGGFEPISSTVKLFAFEDDSQFWRNVSRPTAPYQFSAARHARFAQHGLDMFAAVGKSEPIQVIAVASENTFTDTVGGPRATDIAVVREFLVGINFSRAGLSFPDSVIWSSIVNARDWPTPGTLAARNVQSGQAQIPGGGPLHRIIPGVGGADAIIVAESRIWRMTYVGPPSIWQFDVAVYNQGTTIPGSVAAANEALIYRGRDDFQMFNGGQSMPIGVGKINDSWITDSELGVETTGDQGFQAAITSAIDSFRQLYFLSYPSRADQQVGALATDTGAPILTSPGGQEILIDVSTGKNDAVLAYNYITGRWGYAQIELDALDFVDTQQTTVDQPRLVAIGADNFLSTFDGATLEMELAGPEFIAGNAYEETVLRFLAGTDAPGVRMKVFYRNLLSDTALSSPERGIDNDGYIPVTNGGSMGITARYWRPYMRIPASVNWTFVKGVHAEVTDGGVGSIAP